MCGNIWYTCRGRNRRALGHTRLRVCAWRSLEIEGNHSPALLRYYNLERTSVLEPSEEGGFTVVVPGLPGCISEGETRDEALENIKEAIELYLEPVEDDICR